MAEKDDLGFFSPAYYKTAIWQTILCQVGKFEEPGR